MCSSGTYVKWDWAPSAAIDSVVITLSRSSCVSSIVDRLFRSPPWLMSVLLLLSVSDTDDPLIDDGSEDGLVLVGSSNPWG